MCRLLRKFSMWMVWRCLLRWVLPVQWSDTTLSGWFKWTCRERNMQAVDIWFRGDMPQFQMRRRNRLFWLHCSRVMRLVRRWPIQPHLPIYKLLLNHHYLHRNSRYHWYHWYYRCSLPPFYVLPQAVLWYVKLCQLGQWSMRWCVSTQNTIHMCQAISWTAPFILTALIVPVILQVVVRGVNPLRNVCTIQARKLTSVVYLHKLLQNDLCLRYGSTKHAEVNIIICMYVLTGWLRCLHGFLAKLYRLRAAFHLVFLLYNCVNMHVSGWCDDRCVEGDATSPSYATCTVYNYGNCTLPGMCNQSSYPISVNCTQMNSCTNCTNQVAAGCFWCDYHDANDVCMFPSQVSAFCPSTVTLQYMCRTTAEDMQWTYAITWW